MTDINKEDTATKAKQKRDRSPAFPFIPLKTAIARLVAFEQMFGRHPSPAKHSGKAWGFKGWTSQTQQTLAALKSFGLLEYKGSGDALEVSISEDGRVYLRAQQESIKKDLLKRFALKPKNLALFFSLWGADRPPDPVCLDHLVLKSGFFEMAAKAFLRVYDDTIAYAGLADSDTIEPEVAEPEEEEMPDIDQHSGSESAKIISASTIMKGYREAVPVGMREVKFPLAEGDVRIIVPEGLSSDSVEDLTDYFEVFLKKARREAGLPAKLKQAGNA